MKFTQQTICRRVWDAPTTLKEAFGCVAISWASSIVIAINLAIFDEKEKRRSRFFPTGMFSLGRRAPNFQFFMFPLTFSWLGAKVLLSVSGQSLA